MRASSSVTVRPEPAAAPVRHRRRLARTFSRARWSEYRRLLEEAAGLGYRLVSLEDWLLSDADEHPALILRHDVDQHPRSVRPLLRIEQRMGVHSTWYFRWRTADARIIGEVKAAGGQIGLHYETLTRRLLRSHGDYDEATLEVCRQELRREVAAFNELFGPTRSACPHGDSRLPGVSNQLLTRGVDLRWLGLELDGNESLRGRRLGYWLTDRNSADGSWKDGVDPLELLRERRTPILCLTHPNNLVSGPSLWLDRLAAAALPAPPAGGRRVLIRTGIDDPPPSRDPVADTDPLAQALAREVRQFYASRGEGLESPAGLNTLLTNSRFAERRTDTLLEVLFRHSDVDSLAGLRVLDVGCGFGALAAILASRGAQVMAVDAKSDRFAVGRSVCERFGLDVTFARRRMERADFGSGRYDVAILNNSFCYLIDEESRRSALQAVARALRPGGWLVMRNPNRLFPLDQFTGLPLLGLLGPRQAETIARILRRRRSRVRLTTTFGARRELRRAGFVNVTTDSPREGRVNRLLEPVARYQHVVAAVPSSPDAAT